MIPSLIHYVWVGSPLPESLQGNIDSWTHHNPDYQIMVWNENNIDFSIPAIANAYRQRRWARVSDIVRLMAVRQYGGIYLDTDFLMIRPLDRLLEHGCFIGFQTQEAHSDWVANGAFGAVPGHWFVAEALAAVLRLTPLPFGLDRPTRSGPKLVTRLLRRHGLSHYDPAGVRLRDVFVLPTPVFYPYFWNEAFTEDCIKPETLAVHLWAKSWQSNVPALIRLAKSMRNHLVAGRS